MFHADRDPPCSAWLFFCLPLVPDSLSWPADPRRGGGGDLSYTTKVEEETQNSDL